MTNVFQDSLCIFLSFAKHHIIVCVANKSMSFPLLEQTGNFHPLGVCAVGHTINTAITSKCNGSTFFLISASMQPFSS